MLHKTDKKFSTKTLMAAKEAVRELQDMTAEMEGALAILDLMNSETDGLFEKGIIHECSEMMTVFNRLMHEQEAKLRHMQMMQIVGAKAEREYGRWQKSIRSVSKPNNAFKN